MRLDEDMHVHSTFSDGKGTIEENVRAAEARGLRRLGCVDHVRRETDWLPDFVNAVRTCAATTSVELFAGVEAKLLDEQGTLDVPCDLTGVDLVYAADHRFPLGHQCFHPRDIRQMLESGELTKQRCIDALVSSLCGAVRRTPRVVIAHMFSILPKIGLSEADVSRDHLERLARSARLRGAKVEFDERWNCPGPRVLRAFRWHGVEILCSSDAHMSKRIGDYHRAPMVAASLTL